MNKIELEFSSRDTFTLKYVLRFAEEILRLKPMGNDSTEAIEIQKFVMDLRASIKDCKTLHITGIK